MHSVAPEKPHRAAPVTVGHQRFLREPTRLRRRGGPYADRGGLAGKL